MVCPEHPRRRNSSVSSSAPSTATNGVVRRRQRSSPRRNIILRDETMRGGLRNVAPWARQAITSILEHHPRLYRRWSESVISSDSDTDTNGSTVTSSDSDTDHQRIVVPSDGEEEDGETTNKKQSPIIDFDRILEEFAVQRSDAIRCVVYE